MVELNFNIPYLRMICSAFSFSHQWNTEKQICQYSLLDNVYFLVNFQSCPTKVVYWGNTWKYTPSRPGPILAFPVLAQLYWDYIFQYWPSSRLSSGNSPQGELLMSPLKFLRKDSIKSGKELFQVPWFIKGLCTRHCKLAHQSQSENCASFPPHIYI